MKKLAMAMATSTGTPNRDLHIGVYLRSIEEMPLDMSLRMMLQKLVRYSWKRGYTMSSQQRLANDLCCSVSTVRRLLRKLEALGLVITKRRFKATSLMFVMFDHIAQRRNKRVDPPIGQPERQPTSTDTHTDNAQRRTPRRKGWFRTHHMASEGRNDEPSYALERW